MISFNPIDVVIPNDINFGNISGWLKSVIKTEKKVEGEIVYLFCSDDYLVKINIGFLQHDTLTDIITFPTTSELEIISGEIYISLERVIDNSKRLLVELNSELYRVIVHGVLHLIGYEDKTKEQALLMRKKENYYLKRFTDR